MNNLSHKVAVASVAMVLGFALGANKEAKAVTFTLTPATSFGVTDQNMDGVGDSYYSGAPFHVGLSGTHAGQSQEDRAFYEFNIANLSLASKVISSAIFRVRVDSLSAYHRYYVMQLFGYRGNGQPDASDFSEGIGSAFQGSRPPVSDFETSIYLGGYYPVGYDPVYQVNFNLDFSVTPFVNELVSKNNAFAGFSLRDYLVDYDLGDATLNQNASLIITTVDVPEPVPEPTTIFGSALALSLGRWLKGKKSSQQNKTKSQG